MARLIRAISIMRFYILLLLALVVSSCKRDKPVPASVGNSCKNCTDSTVAIKLQPYRPLYITGDFDGDHKQDTLYEYFYSALQRKVCDSVPDTDSVDFEQMIVWYRTQQTEVSVCFSRSGYDTLHLGNAMGLNCLINIGDNNKDHRDEIALSRDNVDFSGLGSCFIYTLCSNKWQPVKQISILETAAFSWETDTTPVFKDVPGFLEKHNGRWMYSDYMEQMRAENEDDLKMKKLVLDRCCDK